MLCFVTKLIQNLRDYARNVVEKKAREEAGKVLIRMKDRFSTVFNHDNDSMPRVWTGKEDIRAITKEARSAVLCFAICIGQSIWRATTRLLKVTAESSLPLSGF